jgi:hypothetical protein
MFLEFGHPNVNAIFVPKILYFWLTCGLVLALRQTTFYKIPISGLAIMPLKQKKIYFEMRAVSGNQFFLVLDLCKLVFIFINS